MTAKNTSVPNYAEGIKRVRGSGDDDDDDDDDDDSSDEGSGDDDGTKYTFANNQFD